MKNKAHIKKCLPEESRPCEEKAAPGAEFQFGAPSRPSLCDGSRKIDKGQKQN